VARAAAIDGGEWTGAGSAPVAGGVRPRATPRRDRVPSASPTRGGSAVAALVSLVVHAAIVGAAALSLGAPQPTGEPDAIAVELVASTGAAPAAATTDPGLAQARRAARDEASPSEATPSPPRPDVATLASPSPVPATTLQPAEALDARTTTQEAGAPANAKTDAAAAPQAAAAVASKAEAPANPEPTNPETVAAATQGIPPLPPARNPAPGVGQTFVAPASTSAVPPPRSVSAPPEADFIAAPAAPRAKATAASMSSTAARATARLEPAARPSGAHAAANPASAPAPVRGAAEIAAYRNTLRAKIWGLVRYPESARERGATGVATVRFALDGVGAVTLADLAQSSGDGALDDEALAAVRRASPLPAPPPGAPRAYSEPIRFELR